MEPFWNSTMTTVVAGVGIAWIVIVYWLWKIGSKQPRPQPIRRKTRDISNLGYSPEPGSEFGEVRYNGEPGDEDGY